MLEAYFQLEGLREEDFELMHGIHGFHGVMPKLTRLSGIFYSHYQTPIRHRGTSIEFLHVLRDSFKPGRRPIKPFFQNRRNQPKDSIRDVKPRVFTRDTVANVHRILKYSTWESAQEQLSNLSIKWDSHIVNQVLKTHPPMQKSWLFFNWVSRLKNFKHDQFTYTTMLDIFGEAGRLSSMNYVFELMKRKAVAIDTVTYTSLMHWVSRSGDVDGAVKLWEEMRDSGCYPTVVSYTAYIKILFDGGRVKEASDVYKEMIQSGVKPNCHTYTVLMEHLVGAGKCREAQDIFQKMQEAGVEPDKAACNILVERCCKTGETETMLHVLQYMKENRLVLRYPVFLGALRTLNAAGESDALLNEANPHISVSCDEFGDCSTISGDDDGVSSDVGVLYFLLKKENLLAVDRLLEGMISRNVSLGSKTVSTIVEANCDRGRLQSALSAFDYSVNAGLSLARTAYLAIIGILIRSNTFPRVVEVVRQLINAGYSPGVYLSTLLIYRLGFPKTRAAAEIFELLPKEEKGVAAYTSMISAYISAGSPEKALRIYVDMQKAGINPSLGTYGVLLSGLEESGRAFEETNTLRREKKTLLINHPSRKDFSTDSKICDLFFATKLLS